MNETYSFWADLLDKFHTATPWIQALWLAVMSATILGAALCITSAMVRIAAVRAVAKTSSKAPTPGVDIESGGGRSTDRAGG
ncbi:MAG TPA: hypothetical protein VNR88_11395 [Hyphomicrobium sp.]|nr:hypothetical protein [Hyphomicrobium sp.]